ncbi:MAG: molecular chaperone HtpG [Kiritimatiellae bacterium]|jgi:molecular chaperone HtpG|nr:molecular chaperone HtpG [Kiritimatiellia bacterium]
MSKSTKKFKTEVQQLLDLVIHSLYSKKEIFLRELLSNASDAIDRISFEAQTQKDIITSDVSWKIKLFLDEEAKTLTISDNGIGMTKEELENNIGTIANSGTKNFLNSLKDSNKPDDSQFIGQFGVGFYASYMVADKVTVLTKRAGKDQPAYKWVSDGVGTYTIEEAEKDSFGTDVKLHFREGSEEYLKEWKVRQIVKEYSDFISYPIVMDVTRTEKAEEEGGEDVITIEEETINSMKAIWKKNKSEISDEEYKDFYSHLTHDYNEPQERIHFRAEGVSEFTTLLYIPANAPFDMMFKEGRHNDIHLYVKNVFIGNDFKGLLPDYLRFVKGVVDSSDLPLNVSREILQDDLNILKINKSLSSRVLKTLATMKKKRFDDYIKFYKNFGQVMKEGLASDFENADKLKDLLICPSTEAGEDKPTDLKSYVDRMSSEQKEIFYLTGSDLLSLKKSPLLEGFKKKGYEVLFFNDPIDEFIVDHIREYDGKALKAIDKGSVDLDTEEEKKETEEQIKEADKNFKGLKELIKSNLDEDIQEVRFTNRLTDSPCCLVSDESAMNPQMERIMRAMNQDVPASKRIMELNPTHPLVEKMNKIFAENKETAKLNDYVELLYNQALLSEGSEIKDPVKFSKLVSDLMLKAD